MSTVGSILMVAGAFVALLAGVGVLRFRSPYARIHAAGKASPIAFVIAALGASFSIDGSGRAQLLVAALAMVLTLPLGVHLLFRAADASK